MQIEEAKEKLKILKDFKNTYYGTQWFKVEVCLEKADIEAIETVLNELERYKMLHLKSVASRVANDLKTSEKHKEDLEMLYAGCKAEIEKKDKVIDEMAKSLYDYANLEVLIKCPAEYEGRYNMELCKMNIADRNCLVCIKEYFYKKVEGK